MSSATDPLASDPSGNTAAPGVEEVPWDWIDRGWEERRAYARTSVVLPATLEAAGQNFDCLVLDISAGGARLHITEDFDPTGPVTLKLDGYGNFAASIAWRATAEIGLKFRLAPDAVAHMLGDIL